ncbi:MAG: site-specific DNA-methyltransferase [Pyrinomonadaceae bacterium]|nr:site-specific DNA-methyltransferase [Pyrinomonadaceae bacterium]
MIPPIAILGTAGDKILDCVNHGAHRCFFRNAQKGVYNSGVNKMPDTSKNESKRAPRNRTVEIALGEAASLRKKLKRPPFRGESTKNAVIHGDSFDILPKLPKASFDLLFADPPYNLTKAFGKESFRERSSGEYEAWLETWLSLCIPLLKITASIYICGDWRSSSAIQRVGSRYFKLRNRITWEREKGRGAKRNWKNTAEDIWFFTVSDDFTFNIDDVKLRRKVLAPYTDKGGPKDWNVGADGNFRDTHPSNIWTDISVPFWSMPENTDHPTQKPEKLLAKIILASTNAGDLILDPFAGSGTTAVAAKKLGRDFIAIESDERYCLLAQKRLELSEIDSSIQGFGDGVFWERNSKIQK